MGINNNTSDVLQPISKETLNKFLIQLRKNLPKTIRGHHYIYNYLKNCDKFNLNSTTENNEIVGRYKPKFYGHKNGKFENCTFIAITPENDYWIFLYTIEESAQELIDCLKNTNYIKWNAPEIYLSVDSEYFYKTNEILTTKRNDWIYPTAEGIYTLKKEQALSFDITNLQENLRLLNLTPDYADIINELWDHKYRDSLKFIENSLKMNGGTGLYKYDQLVAWIAINDYFAPGFLKSVPTERRKGYATIVCKAECQRIAKEYNIDILINIIQGNAASENTFKKIGFKCVNEIRLIEIHNNPIHKL